MTPSTEAPVRILVIDDDEEDFMITRDLLRDATDMPSQVEWAGSYVAGLKVLAEGRHDVAFVDYRMGEKTGIDLLQEAGKNGCPTPLILLTGQSDYEVCVAAGRAGAVDLLIKGQVDAAGLARTVRSALRRTGAAAALRRSEERLKKLTDK
jgi:two-component system cell cycle sensor histidine kinase/response regulator CckA